MHYRNHGHDDTTAVDLAVQKIALDDMAIAELELLHRTFVRRGLDKLSQQAQTLWERFILISILIFISAAGIFTLITTVSPADLSRFIWLVIIFFIIAILLSMHKFYILYIKKDHRIENLRSRLFTILTLGGLILFTSLLGYYFELYRFGEFAHILETKTIYILRQDHPQFYPLLKDMTGWMIKSSLLAMTSLITTIIIAFSWFFLNHKVERIEHAEFESLISE